MNRAELGKRITLLDVTYVVRSISVGRAVLLERADYCPSCCTGAKIMVEEDSPLFQLACEDAS